MDVNIPLKTTNTNILDVSVDNIQQLMDNKKRKKSNNNIDNVIYPNIIINNKKDIKAYKKFKLPLELGFEYDPQIKSDQDFCNKILEKDLYTPSSQRLIDYYTDISKLLELTEFKDTRNIGTLIGMTVLGIVGFLAFSFTIVGGIAGGIIGIALGRYAGKKITRKIKRKKSLTNEELFKTKLECLIKWGELQAEQLKLNINEYRMIIEKIIEEFSAAVDISLFQKPKSIKKILDKLKKFLMRTFPQRAILLSYKLFKSYLRMVDLNKANIQLEIANKIYFFFMTYRQILELSSSTKTKKKVSYLVTYQKIVKLIDSELIQEILKFHPNIIKTAKQLEEFKSMMRQQVDLNKKMIDFATNNKQLLLNSLQCLKDPGMMNSLKDPKLIECLNENVLIDNVGSATRDIEDNFDTEENADKRMIYISTEANNINIMESVKHSKHKNPININQIQQKRENMINLTFDANQKRLEYASIKTSSLECYEDDNELIKDSNLYREPKKHICLKANMTQVDEPRGEDITDEILISFKNDSDFMSPYKDRKPPKPKSIREINNILKNNCENNDRTKLQTNPANDKLLIKGQTQSFENSSQLGKSLRRVDSHNEKGVDLVKMPSDPELPTAKDIITSKEKAYDDMKNSRNTDVHHTIKKRVSVHMYASNTYANVDKEVIFRKILSIDSDSYGKWDKVMDNVIMKIQKIKTEESPVVLIRGIATLNDLKPKEIFDVIYDSSYRAKWDTVINNFKVIEKIDQYTDIIYFLIKAPFGVSNRDFLQTRRYQMDYPQKGHIIISFQSTTHPSVPPIKGCIRGDTITSGYIIRPHPKDPLNSSELVIISQVDIKGSIPKTIVNHVASKAPLEWVNKLIKAAKEKPKKQI